MVFMQKNAQSKAPFAVWLSIIKQVDWNKPMDIISSFNNADMLGNGSKRVVFNIGGNKFRLICHYYFGKNRVHLFVNWVGTHAEYTKLCLERKQYTVNEY